MKYIKITAIVLLVLVTVYNTYAIFKLNGLSNYSIPRVGYLFEKNPECKDTCVTGFTQEVYKSINELQSILGNKK